MHHTGWLRLPQEIVENLESALMQFESIVESLGNGNEINHHPQPQPPNLKITKS